MVWKNILLGLGMALLVSAMAMASYLFSEIEAKRFMDPSRTYSCVVTVPRWERMIPRFPGQGSDASCRLEIFRDGKSYGKIPIQMLQFLDMFKWKFEGAGGIPVGAKVRLEGEWDFKSGTCFYWNESGNRKIWVR